MVDPISQVLIFTNSSSFDEAKDVMIGTFSSLSEDLEVKLFEFLLGVTSEGFGLLLLSVRKEDNKANIIENN